MNALRLEIYYERERERERFPRLHFTSLPRTMIRRREDLYLHATGISERSRESSLRSLRNSQVSLFSPIRASSLDPIQIRTKDSGEGKRERGTIPVKGKRSEVKNRKLRGYRIKIRKECFMHARRAHVRNAHPSLSPRNIDIRQ